MAVLFTVCVRADITSVRAEPNLEKRSSLALDEADEEISAARKAYEGDQREAFRQHIALAGEMAELSYQSLQDTGKKARRSPKWFKRAEQRLLGMLRRIDSLLRDVSTDDRPEVESLQKQVRAVHDQILHDIMTRK